MVRFSHAVRYSDFVKLGFVIFVALVVPACKDHELAKLKDVRDEVCACKAVPCAEAALTRVPPKDVKSTTRSQTVAREMMNCLAELYAAEQPTPDPDEPTGP
jgi:hypothetical protein